MSVSGPQPDSREARLAAALRDNLRRRKVPPADRAEAAAPATPPDPPPRP